MGFSKKHQVEVTTKESEGKKWIIAGIGIRPISTKVRDGGDEDDGPTTPTARESRVPENLACPPPPRKRRPAAACQVVREFFVPPDLESVFVCNAERAN